MWSQRLVRGAKIQNRVEAPKGGKILMLICPMLALAAETYSEFELQKINSIVTHGVYRVSQEECARLQESVPYVKL